MMIFLDLTCFIIMFESRSRKDICEQFWSARLLHSLIMWLVWFELSTDRPNTTNLYIACEKGDWAFDSAINMTEEPAWTTVVFLALFLCLCSAWSILHWANFILPLWVSYLEVGVAGLFHAYWAVSSYGLCFCRCFLTGFDIQGACTESLDGQLQGAITYPPHPWSLWLVNHFPQALLVVLWLWFTALIWLA